MRKWKISLALAAGVGVAACGGSGAPARPEAEVAVATYTVRDTVLSAVLRAAGTAEPVQHSTLSTRLMGTVTAVLVREGEHVRAGQPLVLIDQRDVEAKAEQAAAAVREAEAVAADAATQARRIRALYADSTATRAQLDAAETGLSRAQAALAAAHAAAAELAAVRDYARVLAPFDGTVTKRFVDPGAFAAPGTPLVAVQDGSRLRISVTASPDAVRAIRPGMPVAATIEGKPARGVVEGIVPAAGAVYTVNAVVDNAAGAFLPGSAATLALAQGSRSALLVPGEAVLRQGDLAGVRVRSGAGSELRWVRLGETYGSYVEVLSGVRAGDGILLEGAGQPAAHGASASAAQKSGALAEVR